MRTQDRLNQIEDNTHDAVWGLIEDLATQEGGSFTGISDELYPQFQAAKDAVQTIAIKIMNENKCQSKLLKVLKALEMCKITPDELDYIVFADMSDILNSLTRKGYSLELLVNLLDMPRSTEELISIVDAMPNRIQTIK